jgi:predicted site-specific integrase-resolvase
MVDEVVVMYKDRLARIGCDLLEFIFSTFSVKFMVHCKDDVPQEDLADDLLAVTTHFVASYNGRRAAENRKRRKLEAANGEGNGNKKIKNKSRETRNEHEEKDVPTSSSST